MQALVIAFCFLPRSNAIYSTVFRELAQSFAKEGLRLVLFNYDVPYTPFTLEQTEEEYQLVSIPLVLRDYNRMHSPCRTIDEIKELGVARDEIIVIDRLWQSHDRFLKYSGPQSDRGAIHAAEAFWLDILGILNPKAVLLWGSTTSQMKLLRLVCLEQSIPAYMIERGQLPDSLFLDRFGQFSHSDIYDLECDEPDSLEFSLDAYASAIHDLSQKYPDMNQPLTASPWGKGAGKRILFLGTYALASGLYPRVFRDVAIQTYEFDSQETVYDTVRRFCEENGHRLVAKSHPNDPIVGAPTNRVGSASIDELVDSADIVVCMQTNVTILAMAKGKICIACGPTYIKGRDVVFEAENDASLNYYLHQAVEMESIPSQQIRNRLYFLRTYFKRKHFVSEAHANRLAPMTFRDLGIRLGRLPGGTDGHSVESRISAMEKALEVWRSDTKARADFDVRRSKRPRSDASLHQGSALQFSSDLVLGTGTALLGVLLLFEQIPRFRGARVLELAEYLGLLLYIVVGLVTWRRQKTHRHSRGGLMMILALMFLLMMIGHERFDGMIAPALVFMAGTLTAVRNLIRR